MPSGAATTGRGQFDRLAGKAVSAVVADGREGSQCDAVKASCTAPSTSGPTFGPQRAAWTSQPRKTLRIIRIAGSTLHSGKVFWRCSAATTH